jgi:hypothetical protein
MKPQPIRAEDLCDGEFIARFEDCTLPNSSFHHRDHVRLAWLFLRRAPILEALTRFTDGLKRFAHANGHDGLYHETITWAYLFLVRQRIAAGPDDETWQDFAARNADLLTWRPSILASYYCDETLTSDLAKRVFILPDRCEGGNDGLRLSRTASLPG